jgi:anti-sigma B factor antagonist
VEGRAVDEDDPVQVDEEARAVAWKLLDLFLELARVRKVELTGNDDEHNVRVVGFSPLELVRRHVSPCGRGGNGRIRRPRRRLREATSGYAVDVRQASGSPAAIGEFRIDEERPEKGIILLSIRGEADLYVANDLRNHLSAAIGDWTRVLVVDLSGVTFIDSMGLGALLGSMKRLQAKGGEFRLVVPEGDIRRIFEMTLLDRVFALHATREAALSAPASSRVSA